MVDTTMRSIMPQRSRCVSVFVATRYTAFVKSTARRRQPFVQNRRRSIQRIGPECSAVVSPLCRIASSPPQRGHFRSRRITRLGWLGTASLLRGEVIDGQNATGGAVTTVDHPPHRLRFLGERDATLHGLHADAAARTRLVGQGTHSRWLHGLMMPLTLRNGQPPRRARMRPRCDGRKKWTGPTSPVLNLARAR